MDGGERVKLSKSKTNSKQNGLGQDEIFTFKTDSS